MRITRVLALVVLGGVAGCGHTDVMPSDLEPDVAARLAHAYCTAAQSCGQVSLLESYLYQTEITDCDAQLTEHFSESLVGQLQNAVDRGTVLYHPGAFAACVDAWAALSCGPGLLTTPAACDDAFEGRVADGGACTIDFECGASSHCDGASGPTCGHCVRDPGVGDACVGVACGRGTYCMGATCAARAGAGEPCDASGTESNCLEGLACVPSAGDPTRGTCGAAPIVGAGEICNVARCMPGLVCASSGRDAICRAPRTDGTCETQGDCAAGTLCGPAMSCVPYPGLGEACTSARACAAPARCAFDSCVPVGGVGATCSGPANCRSGVCTGGVCATPTLCTP